MAYQPGTQSWLLVVGTGETGPVISVQLRVDGQEVGGDRSQIDAMLRVAIEAMVDHLENTYPNTTATASIEYTGQLGLDDYPFT